MSVSLVRGKFEGIRENLRHKNWAIDDPNNPGNCCFKDESNPNQCLCNGNYTDIPNKSKTTMNVQILQVKNDICLFIVPNMRTIL